MTGEDAAGRSTEGRPNAHLRKVNAIIRVSALQTVEEKLKSMHVPGISVTKVKGYGEHANFFKADWVCEHARIEIYCTQKRADEIVHAIIESAHTGGPGDGIVVVLPVESVYRVRTGRSAKAEEMGGRNRKEEPDRNSPGSIGMR